MKIPPFKSQLACKQARRPHFLLHEHDVFLENSSNWVYMYFDQCEDFNLTMELSKKVHYSCNQAILLMSINEALLSTLHLPSNQDLILFTASFNVHIMNVNYAKFQSKFDSRTISSELP